MATVEMHADVMLIMIKAVRIDAPAYELVELKNTWMKGYPVGVSMMVVRSPRQKAKVMVMIHPRLPLKKADVMMARGRVTAASLISSDMCTAESAPSKVYTGVSNPTMNDSPLDDHPPKLVRVPKTSDAEPRGDNTHNVMSTAKKPRMWMIRTAPSTIGNLLARKELNMMQKATTAMTNKVPCHRSKIYEASLRVMRP